MSPQALQREGEQRQRVLVGNVLDQHIDQSELDLDAVAARRLLDHAIEAKGLHRAQIERAGFEAPKAAMRLQLRKAVGADRAGDQPLAGGRR